jgi:hypothetical protein
MPGALRVSARTCARSSTSRTSQPACRADEEEAAFNEAFEAQRTLAERADQQAAAFGLVDCVNFVPGEVG